MYYVLVFVYFFWKKVWRLTNVESILLQRSNSLKEVIGTLSLNRMTLAR